MKINPFLLVMSGHYDRDPGLDQYLLILYQAGQGQLNEWRCTSSHSRGQYRGAQHIKGGLIPPVHHCHDLSQYNVACVPEDSSHVKGVEGEFYRITPNIVTTKQGAKRGYFGIHLDANVPGSLGCPVMDDRNFDDFKVTIANLVNRFDLESIPFLPLYS